MPMSPQAKVQRRKPAALLDRLGPIPRAGSAAPLHIPRVVEYADPDPEVNPDPLYNALCRAFARYAKSVGGITLSPPTGPRSSAPGPQTRYWHLDDALRSDVPWPPSLVYSILNTYCDGYTRAHGARPTDAGLARKAMNALTHTRGCAVSLCPFLLRARASSSCAAGMRGVRASAQLDAPAVLCLAAAVWSETYVASLRTRLDVALYMAIACSTGLGSAQLLGESGVRWRDIALWMAANGPQALLISQTFRPYRLTDGRCLSLAAAKLVAIGMYLDGAIAGALSLRDLLSTAYRGSETAERQVLLHVDRENMHIFRNGFDRPLTPAGINVELARLSRIADLEGTVTTGCFRRLVGRQVFNQYGLEIASAVLGHLSMAQTKEYLERNTVRRISPTNTVISGYISARDAVTWANLYPYMRVFTLQTMTNYVDPSTWRDRYGGIPPLPRPERNDDSFFDAVAEWMLSPAEHFAQGIDLVPMLRVVQHEFPGRASGDHRWTKTTETKTRTCPRDREMSPGGVADGSDWSEPAEYVGYGHVVDSDDEG